MKANELRIGNYVMDENYNILTITHEDFMGVNGDGGLPLRPIPLTGEWLVKFGFKSSDEEIDYIFPILFAKKIIADWPKHNKTLNTYEYDKLFSYEKK